MSNLHICRDQQDLYHQAAALFTRLANEAIATHGRFTVALSGGSTPKEVHTLLAQRDTRTQPLAWPLVHVFWGDERCVPPDHPDSNYRMAHETLLAHVPVPAENIYRVHTEHPPQQAAEEYEQTLQTVFSLTADAVPQFDLVFLGMGPDGHTASLFPATTGLREEQRLVVANYVEKFSAWRVTFTAKTINAAQHVVFLVSGADKAVTLKDVLEGPHIPYQYPAQFIHPTHGTLVWLVDQAAAAQLTSLPGAH
ncbi:MAG: 6-phosphogluconolactonase [Candidatus Binatia bacterium]